MTPADALPDDAGALFINPAFEYNDSGPDAVAVVLRSIYETVLREEHPKGTGLISDRASLLFL